MRKTEKQENQNLKQENQNLKKMKLLHGKIAPSSPANFRRNKYLG
jgi:hypothetical protein